MRVKFKTQQEPGTHLHICRNGTNWTLQSAGGTIEQVVFNDRGLASISTVSSSRRMGVQPW